MDRELIERAKRSLQSYRDADAKGGGSVRDALDIWEEYQADFIVAMEAQERRIEELREVVEYYADWWPESVAHDGGERARKALGRA